MVDICRRINGFKGRINDFFVSSLVFFNRMQPTVTSLALALSLLVVSHVALKAQCMSFVSGASLSTAKNARGMEWISSFRRFATPTVSTWGRPILLPKHYAQ